jgi:hypothetical protein
VAITAYSLPGQTSSVIDVANQAINVVMPAGTDLTNLAATFTLSDGASAKIGTVAQVSGTTANSFVSPVVYAIVAQDGVTTQNWTVNVSSATGVNVLQGVAVNVFPNPSNGVFHVKLNSTVGGSVQLNVFNMTGVKVLDKSFTGSGEQVIDLDLSENSVGIYYLRISNGTSVSVVKLMINR